MDNIESLIIIAKRWFDKKGGNTYHSCAVIVNGKEIGYNKFTYGYGECYLQTALEILQKNNYFNTREKYNNGYSKDYESFMELKRNHDITLIYLTDVPCKKDLE
jgi:hypothetical protein